MLNIGLIATSAVAFCQELPAWIGLLSEFDRIDVGRFVDAIVFHHAGKV